MSGFGATKADFFRKVGPPEPTAGPVIGIDNEKGRTRKSAPFMQVAGSACVDYLSLKVALLARAA